MNIELKREFVHGPTGTEFGTVELSFDGKVVMNGNELSEVSARYFFHFAWKCLENRYAGLGTSKTADECKAAFDTVLEKLIDGTVGTRVSSGLSLFTTVLHRIVMKSCKGSLSKEDYKNNVTDNDNRHDYLQSVFDAIGGDVQSKMTAEAERQIAAAKAEKAAQPSFKIDLSTFDDEQADDES